MAVLEEAGEEEDDVMYEDEEAALDDMPLVLRALQLAGSVSARPQTLLSTGV